MLVLVSCDPGTVLTLQVRNNTDRSVRVVAPAMVQLKPPKEGPGIDAAVGPGQTGELELTFGLGWYAETVRAYADERLVFCQPYDSSPIPRSSARYSIDIVHGQIVTGCLNSGNGEPNGR